MRETQENQVKKEKLLRKIFEHQEMQEKQEEVIKMNNKEQRKAEHMVMKFERYQKQL